MAVRTASVTGVWSNTATWGGSAAPVDGDSVIVNSGITVTIDGTYTAGDDTATAFDIRGTLKASRSVSSSLTCKGKLLINTTGGGKLDYGTVADPIPSSYTADLVLNYSAAMSNGKYGLECPYDSANAGNAVSMVGASKTQVSTATTGPTAGGTTLVVNDATGWAINDEIVVPGTDGAANWTRSEQRTINNISGSAPSITITVSAAFTYAHASNCFVYNQTANVNVKAYGASNYGCTFLVAHAYNSGSQANRLVLKNMAFYKAISNITTNGACFYTYTSVNANSTIDHVMFIGDATNANRSWGACPFSGGGPNLIPLAFTNCLFLRCTAGGGATVAGLAPWNGTYITLSGCHFVGCDWPTSIGYGAGGSAIFNNCYFRANSRVLQGNGIYVEYNSCEFDGNNYVCWPTLGQKIVYNSCKFDKGIGSPTSGTIAYFGGNPNWPMVFNDCQFGTYSNFIQYPTYPYPSHSLTVVNKNLDPLLQEYYTAQGNIIRDNSTYRTAAPAVRMEPLSSSVPVTFTMQVFAPTGSPIVVTGFIKKNAAYGSSNRPTVTLSGLGITPNTWTCPDTTNWEQFSVSGTQSSGTDGMLTLTITAQSAGASAYTYIDDIAALCPAAVNTGELKFWAEGLPVKAIIANYVTANDVWNAQTSGLTLSGSIGKAVVADQKLTKAILGLSA